MLMRVTPVNPDWARMLNDLVGSGLSLVDIAKKVGVEQNTLYYIRNCGRTNIKWITGIGIYNLWLERCGDGQKTS